MLALTLIPRDERGTLDRTTHVLLSPTLERTNGTGPTVDLGSDSVGLLVASLGINHVIENERLAVSIWGSADGYDWGDQPLLTFPPKSYCGVYSTFLRLA